jgi:hypothetical protein
MDVIPPGGGLNLLDLTRGVGEDLPNVFLLQIRLSIENFGMGVSGDQSHNHANRHAHAAKTGLAPHYLRTARDAIEIGHVMCLIVA